jgi:hypothetical protein
MARRAVQEGRLAWLVATAAKTVAVPLSHRLGRPLTGPLMANLVPTYRCNNACFMCDLPKPSTYEARGDREFTTEELKAVIDDMAAIGVAGLSLAGGEPTVRHDCFELLAHGRRRGLFVHLNTNGYNLLARPDRIDELLATGVDSMNFSVDGATAETHNRLRNGADPWSAAEGPAGGFVHLRARARQLSRGAGVRRARAPPRNQLGKLQSPDRLLRRCRGGQFG